MVIIFVFSLLTVAYVCYYVLCSMSNVSPLINAGTIELAVLQ